MKRIGMTLHCSGLSAPYHAVSAPTVLARMGTVSMGWARQILGIALVAASLLAASQVHAASALSPLEPTAQPQLTKSQPELTTAQPNLITQPGLKAPAEQTASAATTPNDTGDLAMQVKSAFVNLHTGPGAGYPVVQVALKGEWLALKFRRGNWVRVRYKQQDLWLSHTDLAMLANAQGEGFVLTEDAVAAFLQRDWSLGLAYGDFNGASLTELSLGYAFNGHVHAELSAGQAHGPQADQQLLELSLYLTPWQQWIVLPYAGIGAGVMNTDPRTVLVQTPDRRDGLFSAEVGVVYPLSQRFIARLGYRHSVISTDRNENEESSAWKLGISVFF